MRIITSIVISLALLFLAAGTACAQGHVADSLLIHLNLDLDKSVLSSANLQVKIHATDHYADYYFSSPEDPDEDNVIDWNQDLQVMVSDTVPMRLIFHISDTSGAALPSGYSVDWNMNGDIGDQSGSSYVIPADASGDMNLSVQGTVTSQ